MKNIFQRLSKRARDIPRILKARKGTLCTGYCPGQDAGIADIECKTKELAVSEKETIELEKPKQRISITELPCIDERTVCINDPQLFRKILENLDLSTLRTLRFVSRSWNEAICRFLRKTIVITIYIGVSNDSRTKEFCKLLLITKNSEELLPFRYLRLNIADWEDEMLDEILADERILPREICLRQDTSILGYEERLRQILVNKASRLEKLGLNVGLTTLEPNSLHFPYLLVLFMTDNNSSERYSDFVVNVINSAPHLRILWLFGQDPNFVSRVVERAVLNNIYELGDLCMQSVHSVHFSLDKFPSLKKLTALQYPEAQTSTPFGNVPLAFVKMYSRVVEELQIFWDPGSPLGEEKTFPYCPQLKSLYIRRWGGSIGAFSPQVVPNLKEIIFFEEIIPSDDADPVINMHPGVETFILETYKREPERLILQQTFSRFLERTSAQFPNLTTLELFWRIKVEYVRMIVKNFPKLQKLFLYAIQGYQEIIFTGIEEEDLKLYVREGVVLRGVERMPCLIDLKDLRELTLLEAFVQSPTLTRNGVVYGISGIPRLEQLTVHYESKDIAKDVLEALSHLRTIHILSSNDIWEYKVGRQQQRLCSYMKKVAR